MKKINYTVLIFLMLFGLTTCTPSKYIVAKQSEIMKMNLDRSATNYIPISDEDLTKSKILDSAYNLIIWNRFSNLKLYIKSLEASKITTSDLYLAKTLLFIIRKKYDDAMVSLGNVKESDYVLLRRLLSIDLTYETTKSDEENNYNELLKRYQDLIDANPDNVMLNKIVFIRMRYLRYNY
ncbi:MAG TPA: hypothetical protein VIH57_19085 [Bacteroidales bacterium]